MATKKTSATVKAKTSKATVEKAVKKTTATIKSAVKKVASKAAETVAAKEVSVWIVPGLAFTCDGRRIGYGGGWYDRFLSAASQGALKLGVAYSFQLVDSLPVEPHDVPLTAVISDSAN